MSDLTPAKNVAHRLARLPACLVVSNEVDATDLLAWIGPAREAFDLTVAVGATHPTAYAKVRRACARSGIRFVAVPTPRDTAAVIASRHWDCVEIRPADASLLSAVRPGTALSLTRIDDPALVPEAARLFDLVLCGSDAVADRLARLLPNPGALRVSPPLADASSAHRRLAMIRAAMATKSGGHAAARPRPSLLQVMPHRSLDSGSASDVAELCRAVQLVDAGLPCRVLSCSASDGDPDENLVLLPGDPAVPDSFDPRALDAVLTQADIVHVHECLTRFGLFIAARARLLGCRVVGTNHGAAQAPFLGSQPHLARLFDVIQTGSVFEGLAALNLPVRTLRLPGPVDDAAFPLVPDEDRDQTMALVLGPMLPEGGIEAVIDALPSEMHLVVAGPQDDAARLGALQARTQGRAVRFVARPDEDALRGLMARAGLYVQVSAPTGDPGQAHAWPGLPDLAMLRSMCTGMPAVLGPPGKPDWPGGLAGCHVAESDDALAALLRRHAEGTLPQPGGRAIRDSVVRHHGLRQFGERYLAMIRELSACAS